MSDISNLFSTRQIFGFLVPGFLLLLALIELSYVIIVLCHFDINAVNFKYLIDYKEYILLIGTALIVLISFYIGLIVKGYFNVAIVKFAIKFNKDKLEFYDSEDLKNIIQKNKEIISKTGYTKDLSSKSELNEMLDHCKYYVVHKSNSFGKILTEIEAEINLYAGSIIPTFLIAAISFIFLFINLFQHDISLWTFFSLFVLIAFFLLYARQIYLTGMIFFIIASVSCFLDFFATKNIVFIIFGMIFIPFYFIFIECYKSLWTTFKTERSSIMKFFTIVIQDTTQ